MFIIKLRSDSKILEKVVERNRLYIILNRKINFSNAKNSLNINEYSLNIFIRNIQSALFITYRSGVLKVNTLYFLRYFDITYFKVFLQKRQKIRYILYFPLWVQ
jgi:hypothetical protein